MLQLLHVDDILVPPERIRKEFDATTLSELKDSIMSQGLFHPLLLRQDKRTLIAGERRLRVLRELYFEKFEVVFGNTKLDLGQVPCTICSLDDEVSILEVELSENTRRANLTWQEEAAFLHRVHTIRKEQNSFETQESTSNLLRRSTHTLNRALVLAPFLDDPEVANAQSANEALKILERKFELQHRQAVAKAFGTSSNSLHQLVLGDLREILPTLEDGRFDAIIADPPYGVSADKWDNMSAQPHSYEDTHEYATELYSIIAREGFRLAKPEAHAYLFCDIRRFGEVSTILNSSGWRVWPWPFILWRGPTSGVCPWPEHGPRRTYESIAFAIKGNRRTLGVFPDLLSCITSGDQERAAAKPIELYLDILRRSCLVGNEVLDPCVGAGQIFNAGTNSRVRVFGIEREEAAYSLAREKLIEE